MKKILFISLAVVLVLSVGLIGCTPSEGEGEVEWNIPVMYPGSGIFAGAFADAPFVFEAMADYVNDDLGGVDGKPINFTLVPVGSDVPSAVAAAGSIIDSSPLITLLWIGPDAMTAVAPIFEGAGINVLSLTMSKTVYQSYNSTMLQYNVSDFGQYVGCETLWINDNNDTNGVTIDNVAVVVDTGAGSQAWWPFLGYGLAAGINAMGKNATVLTYSSTGVVDWTSIVTPWLSAGYDGFCPLSWAVPAAGMFNKMYQLGFTETGRFMYPWFGATTDLFNVCTNNGTGVYYHMSNCDPTYPGALWQSMWEGAEAYLGHTPNPSMIAATANAVLMIKEAIEDSGITGDPANVATERPLLLSAYRALTQVDGICGPVNMYNGFIEMQNNLYEAGGADTLITSRLAGNVTYSAESVYNYYNS